ncbi:MAG: hypothetical protein FWB86_14375 [Treponema sp.]|nr:hypothetical protein [Treponema sp.]
MPDSSDYLTIGAELLENGNYKAAIENFNKALSMINANEITDDDEIALEEIGIIYACRGKANALLNNSNQAVADWKLASDYGNEEALKALRVSGINYTPQKRTANKTSPSGGSSMFPPSYQYVAISHDYINNGAGGVMLLMEPPAGRPQETAARFIFDGTSDGLLIRNNNQAVYLPNIPEAVRKLIRGCNTINVAEKKNYFSDTQAISKGKMPVSYFSDYYQVKVENTNSPLPISKKDYSDVRAAYGIK